MVKRVMFKCPVCRIKVPVPTKTPRVFCACGYIQEGGPIPGLGDYVAAGLHKLGVTRQRYNRVKRAIGLNDNCKCGQRQRKLNELGYKIGIGKK